MCRLPSLPQHRSQPPASPPDEQVKLPLVFMPQVHTGLAFGAETKAAFEQGLAEKREVGRLAKGEVDITLQVPCTAQHSTAHGYLKQLGAVHGLPAGAPKCITVCSRTTSATAIL